MNSTANAMNCSNCGHSCKTTGWSTQLVGGCYCRLKREFVYKDARCDNIEPKEKEAAHV